MKRPAAVAAMLAGTLLPLLPLLLWAVAGRWPYPDLLPERTSGRGLRLLLDPSSQVVRGFITSVGVAVAVTVLALAVGVPAGRALGLYTFRGKRVVQFLLLAPAVVPGLAALLGTQVYFLRYGLSDSVAGVILAQLVATIPYVTLVMAGAFANYDVGYERQARLLGAAPWQAFALVTLSGLRPALTVAGYFAFLISWSEYVLTLLIGGGAVQTLPLLLLGYARGADLTEAAAVAILLAAPPLLLLGLLARGFAPGRDSAAGLIGLGRL